MEKRSDKGKKKEKKQSSGRKFDLELGGVVHMLHVISSMTGALFLVVLLCCIFLPSDADGRVIYVLVLAMNLVCCIGSAAGAYLLNKKDQELSRKEQEAALRRAAVGKKGKPEK